MNVFCLSYVTSYDRFKKYSYCEGGRHHLSTNIIEPATSSNKNLEKQINFSKVISIRKRTKTKLFQRIQVKQRDWGFFFKSFKKRAQAANYLAIKVANKPTRALEFAADLSITDATKNQNAIAANAPSVVKFLHQRKGLLLRKIQ